MGGIITTWIQLGAGAGPLDPKLNDQEGFFRAVASAVNAGQEVNRIILVEANPQHEKLLRHAYRDFPQAEFHFVGITPDSEFSDTKTFFYANEDGPTYHLFSADRDHVRMHYPREEILEVEVPWMSIAEFLELVVGQGPIEMFALDVEGLDEPILMAINLDNFQPHKISFERLHLRRRKTSLTSRLRRAGYVKCGLGLDPHGLDWLYVRPTDLTERIRCHIIQVSFVLGKVRSKLRLRQRVTSLFHF